MLIERIFITPFSLILSQLINNSKTMIYTVCVKMFSVKKTPVSKI